MRRTMILVLLLLLGAMGLGGFWLYAVVWPPVQVAAVTVGPAVRAIYATGNVEPVRWAKVAPTQTGRLVALEAIEGQAVMRGDVLARLDDREAKARVAELAAKLAFDRQQVTRLSALRRSGTASIQAHDQAVAAAEQTAAALAQAQKKLSDLTLKSPLGGVVLQKDGEVGEVAREGQVLYWVGDPSELRVTAEVDEEDIPRIKLGQPVFMKADAFPGQALEGTVSEITPRGDPLTRTYRVRIGLPTDTPLHVGMTVEVNIVVEERTKALLVPLNAVKDGQVWVVEDGRVRRRTVDTGIVGDKRVEIRSGVAAGEQVVIDPPKLSDGQRVRARAVSS